MKRYEIPLKRHNISHFGLSKRQVNVWMLGLKLKLHNDRFEAFALEGNIFIFDFVLTQIKPETSNYTYKIWAFPSLFWGILFSFL